MSANYSLSHIMGVLGSVEDPEIPSISIVDMGMIRDVSYEGGQVIVHFSPTYSGCPALAVIEASIKDALTTAGYTDVVVKPVLSPSWTTDWITPAGKKKLKKAGISPPCAAPSDLLQLPSRAAKIGCPYCESHNTRKINEFGSTPCKALYYCDACQQPFEYFKEY